MKKKIRSGALLLCAAMSVQPIGILAAPALPADSDDPAEDPGRYTIYPVPHSLQYDEGESVLQSGQSIAIVADDSIDTWTLSYAQEVLEENGLEAEVTEELPISGPMLLLGSAKSSNSAAAYWFEQNHPVSEGLFDKTDAYALSADTISGRTILSIYGKDTDAAFYGVSTLKMMLSSSEDNRIWDVHIEDWAEGELRGFIEGFYGSFNYASRASQMRSLRDVKGNLYMFASKTDPYHGGANWGDLYPQDELAEIEKLVQTGLATKVRYGWSVHIGKAGFFSNASTDPSNASGYALYQERLAKLEAKFDQLYAIGVRDFHVLNDDYNSGSTADVVVLLNTLNAYLKEKGDVNPLVYCPNGYNTAWAGNGAELAGLRDLDDDIYLYWTGDKVNSPITQENISWPYEKSGQYPVTWLNYPCSEHDKAGIYLGSLAHYVSNADGITGQRGLMSNPVNFPEANKVAYFQLMSWAWNHENYTDYMEQLWEDTFNYLEPEVADSYRTIARNLSNCPDSGRYPEGFPESEYLKERIDALSAAIEQGRPISSMSQAASIQEEMRTIQTAIADFKARCANEELLDELSSWLSSLDAISAALESAIDAKTALEAGNLADAWAGYARAAQKSALWNTYPNREYPEKMVKAGSKRIEPLARKLLSVLNTEMMPAINPDWNQTQPVLYSSYSSTDDNTRKMFDGNESTYASWNIVQKAGDYFGADLGRPVEIHDLSIIQGETDTHHDRFHESVLEYSLDGTSWTALEENINASRIVRTGLNFKARYIRLRVTGFTDPSKPGKSDFWTRVREFGINTQDSGIRPIEEGVRVETQDNLVRLFKDGAFEAGQSASLDLGRLAWIGTVSVPDGLKAEVSENGVIWNEPSNERTAARYLRITNTAGQPIESQEALLEAELSAAPAPSVSTNITALRQGSWDHLTDGDRSTNVWTGVNQAAGQYIEVDYHKSIPLTSLALYMSEQRPRLYHGQIKASENGTDWTLIGEVDASNDTTVIEGSARVARFVLDAPVNTRYVRIDITDSAKEEPTEHSAYLNLYELELNNGKNLDGSPEVFTSSIDADFSHAADGSLSTLTSFEAKAGDTLSWKLTEGCSRKELVILQSPDNLCNALVQVRTASGWKDLGRLDQAFSRFALFENDPALEVRLSFDKDWNVSLYEMMTTGSFEAPETRRLLSLENPEALSCSIDAPSTLALPASVTGLLEDGSSVQIPVSWNLPEITEPGSYEIAGTLRLPEGLENPESLQPVLSLTITAAEEQRVNLALNRPVEASGHEVSDGRWRAEKAVDGIKDTEDSRWSSGLMKSGNNPDQTQTPQWLIIDLGDEKPVQIEEIVLSFYRKVYPTAGSILVSDDKENWSELSEHFGLPANGPLDPVQTITLETPVRARYVKLLFSSLNPAAAGNALSLREAEIFGRAVTAQPEETGDKTLLAFAIQYAHNAMLDGSYETLHPIVKERFEAALAAAETVANNPKASQQEIDEAWTNLSDAIHLLGFTADKTRLNALITQAEAIEANPDAWSGDLAAFGDALNAARETASNPYALDASITQAADALEAAMAALSPKEEPALDTRQLELLIAACDALETERYIESTLQPLLAELASAKTVLSQAGAQAEIDSALAGLHERYLALRLKADESLLAQLQAFLDRSANLDPADFKSEDYAKVEALRNDIIALQNKAEPEQNEALALAKRAEELESVLRDKAPASLSGKPASSAASVKTSAATSAGWFAALGAGMAAALMLLKKRRK